MSASATQQKYPALADIVRQETEGGRQIVRFYMRVADGTLDDFQDRHRMTAARRLDKIAPGLVDEYLRKYAGSTRRGRAVSSTVKRAQAEGRDHTPRPISVFQRRLATVTRDETGDGKAIVDFIADVMYGTITGFKPYHRLEAATELAGYILHDESYISTPTPWFPNPKTNSKPAVPTTEPVVPTTEIVVPAKAGTHPDPASTESEPISAETVTDEPDNEIVVPAKAGTHPKPVSTESEPVSTEPDPVHADPEPAHTEPEPVHAEPESVRPEPVEGAVLRRSSTPETVESPQLPTNNQKLTTNNPPLAPELARYIARAENGTDLRMQHWQQAYDALVERSQNEDVTELHQWLTGQVPGPDNRFIWDDNAIPPEVIFRPEIDYASMDPADLIDPTTGYTPELDHRHPSTPWMLRCSQDCDVPQHNHAPRRIAPIIDARRIAQRLRDRQYEPDPPSYPGFAFNPRGRSPPA